MWYTFLQHEGVDFVSGRVETCEQVIVGTTPAWTKFHGARISSLLEWLRARDFVVYVSAEEHSRGERLWL